MTTDNNFLQRKKKIDETMKTELGTVDVRPLESQITYPGQETFNLRNVSFAPAENSYLNLFSEENKDEKG